MVCNLVSLWIRRRIYCRYLGSKFEDSTRDNKFNYEIQSNPVITTSVMRHLVYTVRYSVVPINSALLTVTLYSSVITALINDVITEFDSIWQRRLMNKKLSVRLSSGCWGHVEANIWDILYSGWDWGQFCLWNSGSWIPRLWCWWYSWMYCTPICQTVT
jgi:hypothetical protein